MPRDQVHINIDNYKSREMKNINQQEFIDYSKNKDTIILDVRRPDECAKGIIPNAITIDYMDGNLFSKAINDLDKSLTYLVYCRSGNRSGKACQMMDALGFSKTNNLKGGMLEWGGEIVTPV